jgi:hypothetical protein
MARTGPDHSSGAVFDANRKIAPRQRKWSLAPGAKSTHRPLEIDGAMGNAPQYFLRYQGRVHGPYGLERMRELDRAGRLPADLEIAESATPELYYPRVSLDYLFRTDAPLPAEEGAGAVAMPTRSARPPAPAARTEPPPPPKKSPWAVLLATLAAICCAAIFVKPTMVSYDFEVELPALGRDAHLGFDFTALDVGLKLDVDSFNLQGDARNRLQEEVRRRKSYGDLLQRIDPETARVQLTSASLAAGPLTQTRWLGLAMIGLLGGGSFVAILVALTVSAHRGSSPSAVLCTVSFGLLALAATVAFRQLGLFHGTFPIEREGLRQETQTTEIAFFLALLAGALITLSGFVLPKGRHAGSARRRGR